MNKQQYFCRAESDLTIFENDTKPFGDIQSDPDINYSAFIGNSEDYASRSHIKVLNKHIKI